MKKFLLITFTTLLFSTIGTMAFSQEAVPAKKSFVSPWNGGDYFLGVNSQGQEISIAYYSLSPLVGWAPSDKDMLYGSVNYTDAPRTSTFKVGWNRLIYKSLYVGVGTTIFGQEKDWPKTGTIECGVYKRLWSFLLVSPKLCVNVTELKGTTSWTLNSGVTFAVKLH